jgi:hypothetical protein
MLLWVGCIAGALEESEYVRTLQEAGFESIGVERTRDFNAEDARQFLAAQGVDVDAIAPLVQGKVMSAFIRAVKPSRGVM